MNPYLGNAEPVSVSRSVSMEAAYSAFKDMAEICEELIGHAEEANALSMEAAKSNFIVRAANALWEMIKRFGAWVKSLFTKDAKKKLAEKEKATSEVKKHTDRGGSVLLLGYDGGSPVIEVTNKPGNKAAKSPEAGKVVDEGTDKQVKNLKLGNVVNIDSAKKKDAVAVPPDYTIKITIPAIFVTDPKGKIEDNIRQTIIDLGNDLRDSRNRRQRFMPRKISFDDLAKYADADQQGTLDAKLQEEIAELVDELYEYRLEDYAEFALFSDKRVDVKVDKDNNTLSVKPKHSPMSGEITVNDAVRMQLEQLESLSKLSSFNTNMDELADVLADVKNPIPEVMRKLMAVYKMATAGNKVLVDTYLKAVNFDYVKVVKDSAKK